jgi:hypothetical protein
LGRTKSASVEPGGVDEYIAACPKEVQGTLKKIRAAIREVAPGSTETVSYFQMPGYSYEGYDYHGMFVWFSFRKPDVRLHLRPPQSPGEEAGESKLEDNEGYVCVTLDGVMQAPARQDEDTRGDCVGYFSPWLAFPSRCA